MPYRYTDLNSYLRGLFGCRVQKITVDAGLTCPNRDGTIAAGGCIYCNSRGSGTGAFSRGISITEQLTQGKRVLGRRYKARKFMAYFQSFSNTYAPVDRLRALYDEALSVPDVVGLAIGTRPDCISEPILDLLAGYAASRPTWLEYGLQSARDDTLRLINRGHDLACFLDAVHASRRRDLKVCAHAILGLPGETRADMLGTARTLADAGIDGLKLHVLYVVRGTRLETLYRSGGYRCMDQSEYVERVCDFLEHIPAGVVIQRLTGDPHPEELVAPAWCLDKASTLAGIRAVMEKRDTRQGRLSGPGAAVASGTVS
jgi:uncharacterized protein